MEQVIPPLDRETAPLYQILADIIREQQLDEYERYIRRFPFSKMNSERFEYLFTQLVNFIAEYGTQEMFRATINVFKENNPGEDQEGYLRMIDRVWVYRQVNDKARIMVSETFPEQRYPDYLAQFIATDGSPEVLEACHRLEKVYGPQKLRVYLDGVEALNEQGQLDNFCNIRVLEFLRERIKHRRSVAKIPKYLRSIGSSDPDPVKLWIQLVQLEYQPQIDLSPPTQQELDEALTYLDIYDDSTVTKAVEISEPEIKRVALEAACQNEELLDRSGVAAAWERMLPIQRRSILVGQDPLDILATMNMNAPLLEDIQIYRVLGPVNISPPSAVPERCRKYGGCRMFNCLCFADQTNPEEDDNLIDIDYERDWFHDHCDYIKCGREIKLRHRAVRSPTIVEIPGGEYLRYQGSWEGCYCSWKCARNDLVIEPYTNKTPEDVDYAQIAPLTRLRLRMIQFYEQQMNDLGIFEVNDKHPDHPGTSVWIEDYQ